MREYFTIHGTGIELDETQKIAKNSKSQITVYGNYRASDRSLIYVWTFKADRGLGIGIDASNKECSEGDFSSTSTNKYPFYSYFFDGNQYSWKDGKYESERIGWKNDDIIKMELNAYNKTLIFYVNDKQVFKHFDIDFENERKYVMAALLGTNRKLEILNFEQIHHKNNK